MTEAKCPSCGWALKLRIEDGRWVAYCPAPNTPRNPVCPRDKIEPSEAVWRGRQV